MDKKTTKLASQDIYHNIIRKKMMVMGLLIPVLALSVMISISSGTVDISGKEIFTTVMSRFFPEHFSSHFFHYVTIWDLRLPRIVMAILLGCAFGMAGTGIQTILNNPLASPYTMGISSGAGFGAAVAITFGAPHVAFLQNYGIAASAFFFSMLTCWLIYFISRVKKDSTAVLVLSGIALMYLFSALLALIQYFASEQVLQQIVFWLFGSLEKAQWPQVWAVLAVIAVVGPFFYINAWKLTTLRLGDEAAQGLGIDTERLRLIVLILSSLLTAAAVCFTGVIGFIGLVAPHISRMLVGEDQRFQLPGSCLVGAILLMISDTAGRTLIVPYVLPVGIVTSFIGAPFFLYLILSKGKIYWQ